jgi:Type II secretion system (T2SS), protein E, N-terminal domain
MSRAFMYDSRVRLPDLLVSEGIVHAETVVEIFEAQALYGGSFDTNLLELGILDERRLLPYLERAFSLQNRVDVTTDPSHDALERLPRRYAEQHRMVPFRLIGRTLDVVSMDPSDLRALDEIAFVTGCRLQANVATEARVAQHLARGYGVPLPARLANVLAGKTWLKPLTARPGRLPRPRTVPVDVQVAAAPMMGMSYETGRVARVERAVALPPASADLPAPAPLPAPLAPPAVEQPKAPDDSVTERVLRAEPAGLAPPLPAAERPRTEGELTYLLAAIKERDEIPALLLGYLAGLHRVVLLRVKKNELVGWDASGALRREGVADLIVPLDRPSLFARAANDVAPYEGPLPRGQVESTFLDQMGGEAWPGSCLIVPIRVKGRVVALVYADLPERSIAPSIRQLVVGAAQRVAETLVRVILVKKQS